jgi:hypothetical protein
MISDYFNAVSLPAICCHRGVVSRAGQSSSRLAVAWNKTFVNRPGWSDFQSVLAGLRRDCPPALPVVVRASWLPENILGQCFRRQKRFVVLLNDQMGEPQAVETLLHEWAHGLAWNYSLDRLAKKPDLTDEEFQAASHDEAWGCAYSRVWRAYVDLCRGQDGKP